MKKIFLIMVLLFSLTIAKDTSDVHLNDILIKKSSNNHQKDFWDVTVIILPYLISLGGVGIALYTIRNQRNIAQANIVAETKRQWIEKVRQYSAIYNQHMHESQIFFRPFIDKRVNLFRTIGIDDKKKFKDKIDNISMSVFNLEVYLSTLDEEQNNLLKEINDLKQILINYNVMYDENISSIKLVDDALFIVNKSFEIRDKIRVMISEEEKKTQSLLVKNTHNKIIIWFKKSWEEIGEYKI